MTKVCGIYILLSFILSGILFGCSSKRMHEEEHDERRRNYKVVDYSHQVRPGWLRDIPRWTAKYEQDTKKYRYFAFETEPKGAKGTACEIAKVRGRAEIAAQISTFIDNQLREEISGDAHIDENDPEVKALQHFVSTSLEGRVKGMVSGAEIFKLYWEKRKYMEDLGAKKDFLAYTCAVLLRIDKGILSKAVKRASKTVVDKARGNKLKSGAAKALKDSDDKFNGTTKVKESKQ